MLKTGFRAFTYSFSVSLFAIIAANKFFAHEQPLAPQSLNIANKNITLFLKNTRPVSYPVKKIALASLPQIEKEAPALTPSVADEIILADSLDDFDFPLEVGQNEPETEIKYAALTNVVYGPEKPLQEKEPDAAPVYKPQQISPKHIQPPELPDTPLDYSKKSLILTENTSEKKELLVAENNIADNKYENTDIPLQFSSDNSNRSIKSGSAVDFEHVAMGNTDIPIESVKNTITNTKHENAQQRDKEWKPLDNDPWIVAKSHGGKNLMAERDFADQVSKEITTPLKTETPSDGIEIAAETVKNLIIPIPKDIMQDEDLTPKLAYPTPSDDAAKEQVVKEEIKRQEEQQALLSPIDDDEVSLDTPNITTQPLQTKNQDSSGNKLLNRLSSIFKKSTTDKSADTKGQPSLAKAFARQSLQRRAAAKQASIMPTEIRLSFQPNRAEISGHTLRWVQAFAAKTAATPEMIMEIRIDKSNPSALQQKRLNLLYNILTNKGVEYSKINTVFTNREPNSFILRTIILNNKQTGEQKTKNNNKMHQPYIQW